MRPVIPLLAVLVGAGAISSVVAARQLTNPVVVRAGAQATDGAPSLVLRLGAEAALDVALESAAPPVWREQEYRVEVDWRGGRLPIRLELGRISRQAPVRFAYVDAIDIRRLAR